MEVPFQTADDRKCQPDGPRADGEGGTDVDGLVEVRTGAAELERSQVAESVAYWRKRAGGRLAIAKPVDRVVP